MSRVNRVPSGLQDLLGSQNFGDNPSELGQVVIPALDMRMFYHPERRFFFSGLATVTKTADGGITTFQVPENEIWFCTGVGSRFFFANVNNQFSFELSVSVRDTQNCNNPGKETPLANWRYEDNAARTSQTAICRMADFDFMPLLSNETVSFTVARSNLTAVNTCTFDCFVRYLKVRV